MAAGTLKRLGSAILLLVAVLVVAACGSSSSSSKSSASSSANAGGAGKPASTGPGVGKPPVILGDKNFTEEYVLGSLYQQALEAKGYNVTLKGNIGSSEIIYKALKSGQIDMYPEYTGTLLTTIANNNTPPKSAQQTFQEANAFVQKDGFVLLKQTPFYDADGLATTKAYAQQHNLKAYGDLKKLGPVKFGGPPENRTRFFGLVGLKKVYGLNNLQFVPLAEGLNYKALDSGQVQVATIFTTDPQLQGGKYAVLNDTKKLFGFQNVAMVVRKSKLKAMGPAFTQTINKVSSLLTLSAIIKMNAAVSLQQQSPTAVAHQFLAANGLL